MAQDEAEKLLQNSKEQKRHTSEPVTSEEAPDRKQAIRDAYEQIDSGDATSNITVRDENLAALIRGLEATDELERIAAGARAELDKADNELNATRSGTLGDLARIGLRAVAPDVVDEALEARKDYLVAQEDEF